MGRAKSRPASASDRGETTTRRGGRHPPRGGDEQARLASLALLGTASWATGVGDEGYGAGGVRDEVAQERAAAVERAKEAAADEGRLGSGGARSSRDEEEEDRERAGANVGTKDAGDERGEAT